MSEVDRTEPVLIVVQRNIGQGRDDEPTLQQETICDDDGDETGEASCVRTSI
jgi:hypothetical protein